MAGMTKNKRFMQKVNKWTLEMTYFGISRDPFFVVKLSKPRRSAVRATKNHKEDAKK